MGNIGINKLPGETAKEYGYQLAGPAQVGDMGSWDNQVTGKMGSIQVRGQQASKVASMIKSSSHRERNSSHIISLCVKTLSNRKHRHHLHVLDPQTSCIAPRPDRNHL